MNRDRLRPLPSVRETAFKVCLSPIVAVLYGAMCLAPAHAQTTPAFTISGKVMSVDGAALANVHLSAANDRPCSKAGSAPETASNADGTFALKVPCAGVWRLSGAAPTYAEQIYEQHGALSTGIVLTPSAPSLDVTFRMLGSSSITGTVLDEAGDPVRDAAVVLLASSSGSSEMRAAASTTTDIRGMYEFDVAPGTYKVAVLVQPWYAVAAQQGHGGAAGSSSLDPSLDVTYPLTYYPSATDAFSALPIEAGRGSTQEADVHLSPVPAVHLIIPGGNRIAFSGSGGRPIQRSATAPPITESAGFGSLAFQPSAVNVLPNGTIDIDGFTPGSYAISQFQGRQTEEQTLTIGKDSGRSVSLAQVEGKPAAAPATDASGVSLGGVLTSQDKPCSGALLLLVSIAGPGGVIHRSQSNTDGSFSFTEVLP